LKGFKLKPFDIDPAEFFILRVREQEPGGYESARKPGFYDVPEKAKTMQQLYESTDPRERELAETIKQRFLSIVQAYRSAGIIKPEELKGVSK
ncbi:hypothetical protein MUO79_00650, partial [Candidatus Bathyarchaeota archaeon]|nr:hypothetical protein [Candidatus Bathyarchaeota archaeon]